MRRFLKLFQYKKCAASSHETTTIPYK